MSSGIQWNGRSVGYMNFVAPGMLAYATFMTAIFQSLFGAFIRTLSAHLGRSADDADRAAARGVGRDPVGRLLDDELRRDRRARALGLPGDRPAPARARIPARDHPDRVRRRLCVRRPGPVLHGPGADDRPRESGDLPRRSAAGLRVGDVFPAGAPGAGHDLDRESAVPPCGGDSRFAPRRPSQRPSRELGRAPGRDVRGSRAARHAPFAEAGTRRLTRTVAAFRRAFFIPAGRIRRTRRARPRGDPATTTLPRERGSALLAPRSLPVLTEGARHE